MYPEALKVRDGLGRAGEDPHLLPLLQEPVY
jgi:hypothetical protein